MFAAGDLLKRNDLLSTLFVYYFHCENYRLAQMERMPVKKHQGGLEVLLTKSVRCVVSLTRQAFIMHDDENSAHSETSYLLCGTRK